MTHFENRNIAFTIEIRFNMFWHFYFGGSGHAICCYKSGGKFGYYSHLYVFDPNLAEFKVPASEIYLFFAVLHAYYQKNHGRNWWSITPLEVRP